MRRLGAGKAGKLGSGRVVQGLVPKMPRRLLTCKPRLRRKEKTKLEVGRTPKGPSSPHPVVLVPPLPHHSSVSASFIFLFGVGSVSFGVGLFLGGVSVLLGCSRQGLGIGSGCFCIHCPLIGINGNNEAAYALEKYLWIPSSISGHTNCCFLIGCTNATS